MYNNFQHIIIKIILFYINYKQYLDLVIKSKKKRMSLIALMTTLYVKKIINLYNLISNHIICA